MEYENSLGDVLMGTSGSCLGASSLLQRIRAEIDFRSIQVYKGIDKFGSGASSPLQRIRAEIDFAQHFADLHPDKKDEWMLLIIQAAELVNNSLLKPETNMSSIVSEAEGILSPVGKAAKEYTIHCCGQAHIDMNWMWPWQETISVTNDTSITVDRLMEEFPEFRFMQTQAATYAAMEKYCPEVFAKIKKRIAEGKWECLASTWVEGDKNLASGEAICRNVLYAKRYMKERFGLPYDAVKLDWECDTFGHPHTMPTILNQGGIKRYYRHRVRPNNWLIWWKGPDGAKVLAYYDKSTYNGTIDLNMVEWMLDYVKETGLKDYLFMYGVGDHGGGPTRRDLMRARELSAWPIFPNIIQSTTDAYFSAVEKVNPDLPVVDGELNFIFEGCYSSESNIKLANRVSEHILPEIEAISLVAGAAAGFSYPMDEIRKGWRMAMFNQFHDILPGSGIRLTYEHAQGLFQEIQAITGSLKARALRQIASEIDTSAASGIEPPTGDGGNSIGAGIGAGAGDLSVPGGVSVCGAGAVSADPFVVFNAMPFNRSEMVTVKVWNKSVPADVFMKVLESPRSRVEKLWEPNTKIMVDCVAVRDPEGRIVTGQIMETATCWGDHRYAEITFPVKDVPATGYGVYTVDLTGPAPTTEGVRIVSPVQMFPHESLVLNQPVIMENELVQVEIDRASGAIKHLIDKATGYDYVPEGGLIGVLELFMETPNEMSAWEMGQTMDVTPLSGGGNLKVIHYGPNRCVVKTSRNLNDSRIAVEVGLNVGSPVVDFTLTTEWLERGTASDGIPTLKAAFPTRAANTKATYEIPFGSIERPVNGQEVPALRWADISGDRVGADGKCGITLVNSSKYGHSAEDNTLRLTLLRSSYSPDPLPEMGDHEIRFAVIPHDGLCSVSDATRAAAAFNLPLNVMNTDVHKGSLPAGRGYAEVLTSNVMLGGLKKAEDSDAVIVRLYELEGKETEARVRLADLVKASAPAKQVDLMEQPLTASSARMDGDTLVVKIPAHGIVTVAVG